MIQTSVPNTYERVQIGDQFTSSTFRLDADRARDVLAWSGYVHPLFTDPTYAAKVGLAGGIVPGELVLLVLGGLAEQTGVFDETTIALVEFESVKFKKPATSGSTLRLNMELLKKHASSSGRRGFLTFRWTCLDQADEVLLEADAVLAFKLD
jgi:acyl dehydratase